MPKRYWLMKSEPETYSIDDLERDGSTAWEGVRNFKARNNLKAMEVGDELLFITTAEEEPQLQQLVAPRSRLNDVAVD